MKRNRPHGGQAAHCDVAQVACTCKYTYTYTNILIYIYIYIYNDTHAHTSIYIYIYVYVYIYTYTLHIHYIYTYVYVCGGQAAHRDAGKVHSYYITLYVTILHCMLDYDILCVLYDVT